jgi:hypothetical protein
MPIAMDLPPAVDAVLVVFTLAVIFLIVVAGSG